jgi:hypothetical protein
MHGYVDAFEYLIFSARISDFALPPGRVVRSADHSHRRAAVVSIFTYRSNRAPSVRYMCIERCGPASRSTISFSSCNPPSFFFRYRFWAACFERFAVLGEEVCRVGSAAVLGPG